MNAPDNRIVQAAASKEEEAVDRAIRPKNFLRRGKIKIHRNLNKGVGRLFWCVELLLRGRRRRSCIGFRRWRGVQTEA